MTHVTHVTYVAYVTYVTYVTGESAIIKLDSKEIKVIDRVKIASAIV